MGWFARVIDAGHEYRNSLAEVEDGLFLHVGSRRAKLTKFWVQLVLASVIAAGGVITDSTPAVIGAMIIAPLGTPIYGFALGAVVGDRRGLRDSLLLRAVRRAVPRRVVVRLVEEGGAVRTL
jgi:hypothetical protein